MPTQNWRENIFKNLEGINEEWDLGGYPPYLINAIDAAYVAGLDSKVVITSVEFKGGWREEMKEEYWKYTFNHLDTIDSFFTSKLEEIREEIKAIRWNEVNGHDILIRKSEVLQILTRWIERKD